MKRLRLPLLLALGLPLAAGAFWLVSTSRAATETPEYQILRTAGKFEIRDYPALTLATTPMDGAAMNRGFGTLFRFITGTNERAQKIAMTTPVLIESEAAGKTMSFIMPKSAVQTGVPQPSGETVTLAKRAPSRLAVFRFEGSRTPENEDAAAAELRRWLDAQKISTVGQPFFAYYDPPWTPVFLRRNEVLIRLEPQ